MLLSKAEIMEALWESQLGYNEDTLPGDEVSYIDETYNYDSFARRINKLIADKIAKQAEGQPMVKPPKSSQPPAIKGVPSMWLIQAQEAEHMMALYRSMLIEAGFVYGEGPLWDSCTPGPDMDPKEAESIAKRIWEELKNASR